MTRKRANFREYYNLLFICEYSRHLRLICVLIIISLLKKTNKVKIILPLLFLATPRLSVDSVKFPDNVYIDEI